MGGGRPYSPLLRGHGGRPSDAVGAFYHPVRMWVVGSCLAVLDVEQAAEGDPQGGGELGPAVRCYHCRYSKSTHPSMKQSIRKVYC
jgi:hypothetical protein